MRVRLIVCARIVHMEPQCDGCRLASRLGCAALLNCATRRFHCLRHLRQESLSSTTQLAGPAGNWGLAMKRRICVVLSVLLLLALNVERANAECICQCVDGQMQPLCQSSIDLPPICPPAVCPIAPSSITPLNPPTLPPLGTSQCRQARVCDTFGNCQWQQVCR